MKDINDKQLTDLSDHIVNTLKFYGVTLVKIEIDQESIPVIYVNIYKKKLKKSLDETLTIVYWVFWSFFYGQYSKKKTKTYRLQLNYNYNEL